MAYSPSVSGGLDTCVALQLAAEVSRREAAEGNNAEAEGWAEAARVEMKSRPLINRRGSEGNPAGKKRWSICLEFANSDYVP